MKRTLLAALVAMLVSGPAWGADDKGRFDIFFPGDQKCSKFLGDYAKTETKTTHQGTTLTYNYPKAAALSLGWIFGYLSAMNEKVYGGIQKDHFSQLKKWEDKAAWVASWCRDNPNKDIFDASRALTEKSTEFIFEEDKGN